MKNQRQTAVTQIRTILMKSLPCGGGRAGHAGLHDIHRFVLRIASAD